jgi:hemolysin activation/secretion protein
LSGDHGLAGMVELRAGMDPDLDPISFVQGYAFFDAARVWNSDAGMESASLASTGAGVRVTFADRLTASAELARPLTRTPAEEGGKDWRPFFSLSTSY